MGRWFPTISGRSCRYAIRQRTFMALCLVGALFSIGIAEAALHCGRSLVNEGDPQYHVAQVCPEPFWVEYWEVPLAGHHFFSGPFGRPRFGAHRFEAWYINFGSRKLIRRLVFLNGFLQREETLGRGVSFRPGSRRCSPRDLRLAGDSIGEIFAHCGQPDFVFDEPVTIFPHRNRRGFFQPGNVVLRTRWIYDFGARRFDRELTFQDGRLLSIRELNP